MDNFLSHSEFYYTRMILFSWTCDSPPTSLSQSNGESFVEEINDKLKSSSVELIIVNCNDINDIDDHFVDPIIKFLKNTQNSIVFFQMIRKLS